jgi:hypothetical protein
VIFTCAAASLSSAREESQGGAIRADTAGIRLSGWERCLASHASWEFTGGWCDKHSATPDRLSGSRPNANGRSSGGWFHSVALQLTKLSRLVTFLNRAHARYYRDLIKTNELEPIVRLGLMVGLSLWNARILYTMPSPDLGLIFSR